MKCIVSLILNAGLFLVTAAGSKAQGVWLGNGMGTPHPAASLEMGDTTRGLLLNRMPTTQRNALNNPPEGLVIYNTDSKCFEGFTGGGWRALACDCNAPPNSPQWLVSSNATCLNAQNVLFKVAPAQGVSSYTWSVTGGATIVAGQGSDSIWVNMGTQSLTVSVIAHNFCGSSQPLSLNVAVANPNPAFNASPSQGLVNSPVTFSPATPAAQYQWTFTSGNPSNSTANSPQISWASAGTYNVTLIVSANGCTDSSTQQINIVQCGAAQGTQTFSFTGAAQTFTVPNGVCSLTIQAWGAQGANSSSNSVGGRGGYATGTISVTPGAVINIYVGGQNGFNGGGTGNSGGGNGGGASDVRIGGTALSDRIIVAGGGGGGGATNSSAPGGAGGAGTCGSQYCGGGGGSGANNLGTPVAGHPGGLNGGNGGVGNGGNNGGGGGGGGLNSGGNGGTNSGYGSGQAGAFGLGGNAGGATGSAGGGAGYYGGGGSSGGANSNAGGGGGSSFTGTLSNASMTPNVQTGNGQIVLQY
jgi:PKD repeat protein